MPRKQTYPASAARRDAVKLLGLGLAASALPASVLFGGGQGLAQPAGDAGAAVIPRAIPATGEMVPVLGLGTFLTFDTIPGRPRDQLREVMRTYWERGARVIDTSPLYGTAEITVGDFATALGITDRAFIANKVWSTDEFLGDESHALHSLARSKDRLWRERIDLMQCHNLTNVETILPYLRAWKKEG